MKLGVEELKESGLYCYYIRSAINLFLNNMISSQNLRIHLTKLSLL